MIYFQFVTILLALNHFADAHLLQNYEWHSNVSAKNAQLFNDFMAKIEALLKRVFNEQVRYFAYAIKIDYDYCRELSQIAEGLHKILNNELNLFQISRSSTYNNDFEIYEKLKELKDNFEQKKGLINKVPIQKEMVELLSQIIKVYSCSSSSPMCHYKWDLDLFVKNVPKFGQILSEILHNASKLVKYDGTTQLMALPVSLVEHLLGRLYTVVQMLNSSICQIGENVDFVITVENIVSQLPLVFSPRRKTMPTKVNSQLFKLLFSLAIRLSAQMESERLAEKYVNLFISVNKCISISADDITDYCLLQTQIKINQKIIEIELPNWKDNLLFARSLGMLQREQIKKNFDFLCLLSDYSPTIYEIIQMLKIVGEANNAHFWVEPSAPQIFLRILNFSMSTEISDDKVKVPIRKSEFCVLVNFSNDLLERIMKNRKNQNILFNGVEPIEVTISKFELIKQELCSDTEHSGANLINNYFGENLVQYAKAVKIEFDPYKEMNQIVPILKKEIKKMFRNKDWDYATFDCMHTIEWNLLRIDLAKMGQTQKWKQMEKLLKEWRILYNNWVLNKSEMNRPNFAKIMQKIVQNLEMMSIK